MPSSPASSGAVISAATARHMLLHAQGLLDHPAAPAGPAAVLKLIRRLGFVQVDTISVLERAHHHILFSRLHRYRPDALARLLERDRSLFEHWTHDASIIPTAWFAHWRPRFEAYERQAASHPWWRQKLGPEPRRVIDAVYARVRREGPLMSRDFEHPREPGASQAMWNWKPPKAALEYLWRIGRLAIAARVSFQKVYDLTERVLPKVAALPGPSRDDHVDWACRTALERLGAASPGELVKFWHAIRPDEARAWCDAALRRGEVVPLAVRLDQPGGPLRKVVAPHDWRTRAAAAERAAQAAIDRADIRLLSPFDPVIRDRQRLQQLFDFDYRFEGFVPAAQRNFGYYVLPMLEGDRLIGRLDAKVDRARGRLLVHRQWMERGQKLPSRRRRAIDDSLRHLADFVGATDVCRGSA